MDHDTYNITNSGPVNCNIIWVGLKNRQMLLFVRSEVQAILHTFMEVRAVIPNYLKDHDVW